MKHTIDNPNNSGSRFSHSLKNKKIVEAINFSKSISGLTHKYYRYPASFAPEFAREIILNFSKEDDCIYDPFMGGATSIVEALALGRKAIGTDINNLAVFIATVKTTPLSRNDHTSIMQWLGNLNMHRATKQRKELSDPRLKNIPEDIINLLIHSSEKIAELPLPRQRSFARCLLLNVWQWELDNGKRSHSINEITSKINKQATEMINGLDELTAAAQKRNIRKNALTGRRVLIHGSAGKAIHEMNQILRNTKPKLVLTSPPYPGVHVLYHRWQIRGRKETPAPYWIANLQDSNNEAYYTMGGRSNKGIGLYFKNVTDTFTAMKSIIDPNALIVQLVAFSEPNSQLASYLTSMQAAGYKELMLLKDSHIDRPFRIVPNRKWYASLNNNQNASKEILLFHTPV
ncbi:MAG: DNA methyltransferase [Dehalococcoidia bacterium]